MSDVVHKYYSSSDFLHIVGFNGPWHSSDVLTVAVASFNLLGDPGQKQATGPQLWT